MPYALINVRVTPRAAKSGITGQRGDAWLVRLHAAPADGAANAELVELLSDRLDLPKRAISIVAGERSRLKRVRVEGATEDFINAKLAQHS